ncbi:mitochondrial distribution/morphology family 35/apoptosis [Trametes gibbosa]|nr:mitochondrial distribution/morphology family 35/apoptosis [Trametes gibbosa]
MSQSLSEECTPLKRSYDACFNAWFEGYLEPAVSASANAEQRTNFAQQKAAEFESSCGKIWQEYRQCIQKAVKDKNLEALLDQARSENPLKEPPPPPPTNSSRS